MRLKRCGAGWTSTTPRCWDRERRDAIRPPSSTVSTARSGWRRTWELSRWRRHRSPGRPERPTTGLYPCGLTHREVEVLGLIAKGKTSKEVATQLVVTVATVSRHIANIYYKIDARGRADATRFALEHSLS